MAFIGFGTVTSAVLLVLGGVWCMHVFARLPSDIAELREPEEQADRWAILGIWALTLLIASSMTGFLLALARPLFPG